MTAVQSETNAGQEDPNANRGWPPDSAKYIAAEIEQGGYTSEAQLVCDAVRKLREQKIQSLRREIQVGVDDIAQNRVTCLADEAELASFMHGIWQRVKERVAKSNHPVS